MKRVLLFFLLWGLIFVGFPAYFAEESRFYGIWSNDGVKGAEKTLTLKFVSSESKQHDILSNGTIPCYGFLEYSEGKKSPVTTYLISECKKDEDLMRVAVIGQDADSLTVSHIMLQLKNKGMVVSYAEGVEGSIGSLLAGLTLNKSASEADLIKSDQVFSKDRTLDVKYYKTVYLILTYISVIISIIYFFSVFHMLYVLFIRKTIYKKNGYTLEEMKAARVLSGKPERMSHEDYALLNRLTLETNHYWMIDHYNNTFPIKPRYIKDTEKALLEIAEILPTDPKAIDNMNKLVNLLNASKTRKFCGSKMLLIASLSLGALATWHFNNWMYIPLFLVGAAVYYGACLTPLWLINKRENTNSTGIFISILAAVGLAGLVSNTVNTRDGEYNVSIVSLFSLVSAYITAVCSVLFLPLWTVINYIRNYVIYK